MDMSTTYMGLKLANPLVASSSPLSQKVENIRRMEDAGASAIVLWSLFEEQIEHDAKEVEFYLEYGTERFPESITYFPQPHEYKFDSDQYLEHIRKAKQAVDVPIIASLNGVTIGGWIDYARKIQDAGADGLELNVYLIPTDPAINGQRIEDVYRQILAIVRKNVTIPVAMKLSPFFSATANMAVSLADAGANALVLFNRFYQPDIDVKNLEVVPNLTLSTSADSRLPIRWLAILSPRVKCSLAGSSGVHTANDAAKMILAGADAVMMTSSLLINGIDHLAKLREGLAEIMEEMQYESISQMKGAMSQKNCPEPAAFERANYLKALSSFGGWGVATLE